MTWRGTGGSIAHVTTRVVSLRAWRVRLPHFQHTCTCACTCTSTYTGQSSPSASQLGRVSILAPLTDRPCRVCPRPMPFGLHKLRAAARGLMVLIAMCLSIQLAREVNCDRIWARRARMHAHAHAHGPAYAHAHEHAHHTRAHTRARARTRTQSIVTRTTAHVHLHLHLHLHLHIAS